MDDPNSLLATLAQSSAAVVAIVGGFLVSRLVQLSSEREGLRRQLVTTRDKLRHVEPLCERAHEHRLTNSHETFQGWVIEDLVKADFATLDRQALVNANIPPGSSGEEMLDYLDALIQRVDKARKEPRKFVEVSNNNGLTLEGLRNRGLIYDESESEIYKAVAEALADSLPTQRTAIGSRSVSAIHFPRTTSQAVQSTEMRRLDESISEEQELASRRAILRADESRLEHELGRIGHPVGVTSATVVLGICSLLGIVVPVIVMALAPESLLPWSVWALVGLFIIGLLSVLGYILWYARVLSRGFDSSLTAGDD